MSAIAIRVPASAEATGIRLEELAAAIANDRRLHASLGHRVIVRRDPATIVVVGVHADDLLGEVELLRRQIVSSLDHTRLVAFDDAVGLAARLAARLRSDVDDIAAHTVAPIARGGLIVAGMLGYLVPLEKRRFTDSDPEAPVLIVDDIALSGLRVGAAIRAAGDRPITIATLCAPAPLIEAVRSAEPGVVDFVTAIELPDRTHDLVDIDPDAYRERWGGAGVYWVGRTDHVVFGWSEPESEATNPVTGEPSLGWKLAPPSMCLATAHRSDTDGPLILWDEATRVSPPVAPGWVVAVADDTTYVARDAEAGSTITLAGAAHEMFWAVVEESDQRAVLGRLASCFDVDEGTLATDLEEFVGELVAEGVIEEVVE